jgi:hypothetical protein
MQGRETERMRFQPNTGGEPRNRPVSVPEVLRFYLPLVLTSQMMTLSGPIINAGIGRTGEATLNFAAYWIGFAVLLFLESPCLIVQGVAATLVDGYTSIKRLAITSIVMGATATILILAAALTPFGELILGTLIPTTPRVAALAREILLIFSPIPLLVSIRGVANGLAIREKRTVLVARATFVRLLVLSSVIGGAVLLQTGSGALTGATGLVSGISVETILIVSQVLPLVRLRRRPESPGGSDPTYREILSVAGPMAASAVVWTITRPLINAILGLLPDPELAQAGFGVIVPLVLVTCSPLWAIQNVSLVLAETRADLRSLIRFTALTAALFSVMILILAVTPLRDLILRGAFRLSPELEHAVVPAFYLVIAEPLLLALRTFTQGLLMKAKRTQVMMIFSPVRIALVAAVGFAAVRIDPALNGVFLGAALFIGAELCDAWVYTWKVRSFVRDGVLFGSEAAGQRHGAAGINAATRRGV